MATGNQPMTSHDRNQQQLQIRVFFLWELILKHLPAHPQELVICIKSKMNSHRKFCIKGLLGSTVGSREVHGTGFKVTRVMGQEHGSVYMLVFL